MPEKAKLGGKEVDVLVKEDLEGFNKRLDELGRGFGKKLDDVGTVLKKLTDSLEKGGRSVELPSKPPTPKTPEEQYCPECETFTKDLYQHFKKNPEKHGLVKEVPKKRTVNEILSEHDFFDCPECRKRIDEHLGKKGLEIVKTEEETEGVEFEL